MKKIDKTLIIELTDYCNLNCIMCQVTRKTPAFMELSLFRKILKDIKESNIVFDMFLPFWRGECTMHPQFSEFLDIYIKENSDFSIAKTGGFDTNGQFLDPGIIEKIIESDQFSVVTFSVDAFSENTYNKIRKGGNFNKLINNIRLFLDIRRKSEKKFPVLVIQFIVMQENFSEVEKFIEYWKDFFSEYGIFPQLNYDYDKPDPIEKDTIFLRREISDNIKRKSSSDVLFSLVKKNIFKVNECSICIPPEICGGPFTHISVASDGKVYPCCVDTKGYNSIGDMKKESFQNILSSPELYNIRKAHIYGNKQDYVMCRSCPGQVYPMFKKEDIEFLKREFL